MIDLSENENPVGNETLGTQAFCLPKFCISFGSGFVSKHSID